MAAQHKDIVKNFGEYVSSGKVSTFKKYGMEIVMRERQGIRFEDMKSGKWLINCHSNGGVFNLGHRHPEAIQALTQAATHLDIGNHHFISEPRAALAKKLASTMPQGLSRTVFGVSGGEAMDLAIKLARGFTSKQRIVSCYGGYHGHTGLSMAAGDEQYRSPFGANLPDFVQVPFNDLVAMEAAVDTQTAAVIIETIPATLGMPIPDTDYLIKVKAICEKKGALLILDEVQAGLGRTGKLWAFEHFGVVPDMVVIGKGLSGGVYPITATVYHERFNRFFEDNPFIHVSTFGGAEIGCEVAMKVLEMSTHQDFLQHVQRVAEVFNLGLQELVNKHAAFLSGFRQLGMMMALEFRNEDYGQLFTKTAYENGLFCLYANNDKRMSQLLPPLITSEEEAQEILSRIDKAIPAIRKYATLMKVAGFFKRK